MLKKFYNYILKLSASPYAFGWLFAAAFIDSAVFPLPPEILQVTMTLATPHKTGKIAATATLGSVLGSIPGYLIGFALLNELALPMIKFYRVYPTFIELQHLYQHWGILLIFIKALTPVPYFLVTMLSGAAKLNFISFLLATIVSRGVRFYVLGWAVRRYGVKAQVFFEKNSFLFFGFLVVAGIAAFLIYRYL